MKKGNSNKANPLILSIDLDEWYHGRRMTGSPIARWKNVPDFFQDYYKSNKPIGEIIEPARRILRLLKRANVHATFFILGEVAQWYPDLVKEIAKDGHEIACHGMAHRDLTLYSEQEFSQDLLEAKDILEKLIGVPVIGFRAPNLIAPDWLFPMLVENKFLYDSSVCPSRKLFGKYSGQSSMPQNPYLVYERLIELPIPTIPFLRLPGAVSIATRIFGWTWTRITLNSALKTGAAHYYMHPYEFQKTPRLENMSFQERIFWRRTGLYMEESFQKFLAEYKGRIVSSRDYITNYFHERI